MRDKGLLFLVGLVVALSLAACGAEEEPNYIDDPDMDYNDEYGKPMMGLSAEVGKGDSMTGSKTLAVSVDSKNTQVWPVWNAWTDTDTADARLDGIAWGANSGLSWEEKYRAWVKEMQPAQSTEGYSTYTTFNLKTPFGKELLMPRLECAETALFLRATFASWYHLPFIMVAWDSGPVYFGHFGLRTRDGKYRNSPNFKTAYKDHESMTAAEYGSHWPTDSKLKKRKISSSGDDENTFLCEGCFAGAYFDEIFLNKRTGHFLVWLLTYTGSMHLASTDNTFNIKAASVLEGDVLLERWQKKGIGHTLIVKKVDALEGGHISAELASGSMPRRQPVWEDAASSKSYFTNTYCGGPGENNDGHKYAALGGGLKRWRQPVAKGGYWHLTVPDADADAYVNSSDYDAVAARIAEFEQLLGSLTPEEQEQFLLGKIEEKRLHLRNYPASCAARTAREEAFNDLYALEQQHFGLDEEAVDRKFRSVEDYVFAELEYGQSKTCCWNQSTADMYEIIMDYNKGIIYDEATETCNTPEVFKWSNGGYGVFKNFADSQGKGDQWPHWSEDEPCPAAGTQNDVETSHKWSGFCSIIESLLGTGSGTDACGDAFVNNHSFANAVEVAAGSWDDLKVCSTESDWYSITTAGEQYVVRISFSNDGGDIDLHLSNSSQHELDSSATTENTESVKLPAEAGQYFIEVKLYGGTSNTYSLSIEE